MGTFWNHAFVEVGCNDPLEFGMSDRKEEIHDIIRDCGEALLESAGMNTERRYIQHGVTTTYDHSVRVATKALELMDTLDLGNKVDVDSLVKSALLHDYFLYDWHIDEPWHRMHGFQHGGFALQNAERDFGKMLNPVIRDSVLRHMYPLTKTPPKYAEGWLVTAADKMCAWSETFDMARLHKKEILESRVLDGLPLVQPVARPVADFVVEERIRKMKPADTGKGRRGMYKCLAAVRKFKAEARNA